MEDFQNLDGKLQCSACLLMILADLIFVLNLFFLVRNISLIVCLDV